LNNIDDLVIL